MRLDWLGARARRARHGTALFRDGTALTWGALDARAAEMAGRLRRLGVRPGDRVALLAGTSIDAVTIIHAVPKTGAILVPVNPRLSGEEAAWQAADCGARAFIYDSAGHPAAARVASDVPGAARAALGDALPGDPRLADLAPEDFPRPALAPDSLHTIVYTSGTTGRPKGAMLTRANHRASAEGARKRLDLGPEDRWLACMPLCHVGGLSILLRSVLCGFPVVLQDSFDEHRVIEAIAKERVTIVSLVPGMLQRLLDADPGAMADLSSLRCVLLGGAPIPECLLEECLRRGIPTAPTYGLTECASQVATLVPERLRPEVPPEGRADRIPLEGAGMVGRPLRGVEIRILREDGSEAGTGEVGEIAVQGPIVSPGYWGRPEVPPEGRADRIREVTRREGWHATGDLGRMDARGYLEVVGRMSEMIISGGENVSPAEVERVLLSHPDVLDAAVAGSPDPRWGERVVAAVVPRAGARLTTGDLAAHCRRHLAGYKVPRAIALVETLPRNSLGKLLRREVVARIG